MNEFINKKEIKHLEQIAENSFYIGKAYEELYNLELMNKINSNDYKNVIKVLKALRQTEEELYSYYDTNKINNATMYISEKYQYKSGDYITEEILKDYIDYQNKVPIKDDELLFNDALIARMFHNFFIVIAKEANINKKLIDDSNIVNKEIVTNLSYLTTKISLSKRNFFAFAKYDTIMRKNDVEELMLSNNLIVDDIKCSNEYKRIISDKRYKYLFEALSNETIKILDHLNSYTDEMLEERNNAYNSSLDYLFLNSYLILLNEEDKNKIEEYYNNYIDSVEYFKIIQNGGGKKVKKLVSDSFKTYDRDRKYYLDNN